MGMVVYRDLWKSIRDRCAQTFCTYDDYNWDWSLYRVSMTCLEKPLQAMVVRTTRVFHVGECGVHHKGEDGSILVDVFPSDLISLVISCYLIFLSVQKNDEEWVFQLGVNNF